MEDFEVVPSVSGQVIKTVGKLRKLEIQKIQNIHLLNKYHELIYYIIRKGQPVA